MRMTWRERLEQQPGLRDFDRWPVIPMDAVPRARRKRFLRNQQIVASVLAGTPQKTVAERHGLSPGTISKLLKRCLGEDDATAPALTRALVPNTPIAPPRRQSPLPTLATPSGARGAFQAVLDGVPGLREGLDAMILAKLKDDPNAQQLTPAAFHGEFKRRLAEAHWPTDRYPYTSPTVAYEAVRRYLHARADALALQRQRQPRSHPVPAMGVTPFRGQRITQIDEHRLDLEDKVLLVLDEQLIPLRLARATVLVASDVDTTCVLGGHIALTASPNQQDLLTLVDNCIQPWHPLEITSPELAYDAGACFPSALPDAFPITFGTVQLDNAWMHRAHTVVDFFCERLGATLSFGRPGVPTTRWVIEAMFAYLSKQGTHRFASTTGSHPNDPKRESRQNRRRPPTPTLRTLEEVLSVLLTGYNVTPRAALGNATPLELFADQCRTHYVRYVPPFLAAQWHPFLSTRVVPVHWNRAEQRAPYINFEHLRYQGPGLAKAWEQDKSVRIHYDVRDVRTVQAFSLQGEDLGTLEAPRTWMRFPHSLQTRRWIFKQDKAYRRGARDPLAAYFHFLLTHKDHPAMAREMVRVYREYTREQPAGLYLSDDASAPTPTPPGAQSPIHWSPDMAYHRR